MSTNFDKLVKKAKGNASPAHTKEDVWKEYINIVMDYVHKLNEVYPISSPHRHHIKIEQSSCGDCKQGTYILGVRQLDNIEKILRFHRGGWLYVQAENKYYCEQCKKGK